MHLEVIDFGYPQYCGKDILQKIITQGNAKFTEKVFGMIFFASKFVAGGSSQYFQANCDGYWSYFLAFARY